MKKTVKRKNKKIVKENILNKKNIIFACIFIIVIIISILLIENKELTCTKKTIDSKTMTQNRIITFKLRGKHIKSISLKKDILFEKDYIDYIDAAKSALENSYKDSKLKYDILKKDNRLSINVAYDKKMEYILDNIDISIQNDTININVLNENYDNGYAKIDMVKNYSIGKLKEVLEGNNYTCK